MEYKLAKQLKDAGFPYETEDEVCEIEDFMGVTLEELIEACGDWFKKLWRHSNGTWTAHAGTKAEKDSFQIDGKTPSEAVARLWLSLNK